MRSHLRDHLSQRRTGLREVLVDRQLRAEVAPQHQLTHDRMLRMGFRHRPHPVEKGVKLRQAPVAALAGNIPVVQAVGENFLQQMRIVQPQSPLHDLVLLHDPFPILRGNPVAVVRQVHERPFVLSDFRVVPVRVDEGEGFVDRVPFGFFCRFQLSDPFPQRVEIALAYDSFVCLFVHWFKLPLQLQFRVVDAPFDCAKRNMEPFGDVPLLPSVEKIEPRRLPKMLRQSRESRAYRRRPLRRKKLLLRSGAVGGDGQGQFLRQGFGLPPPGQPVEAPPLHRTTDPGVRFRPVPKPGKIKVRRSQSFLEEILGSLGVFDDVQGVAEQGVIVPFDKRRICVSVPGQNQSDGFFVGQFPENFGHGGSPFFSRFQSKRVSFALHHIRHAVARKGSPKTAVFRKKFLQAAFYGKPFLIKNKFAGKPLKKYEILTKKA